MKNNLSLSTKLTIAYSILVSLAIGALALSLYLQLRIIQRQGIRERLQELVSLAAPQIDSEFHALIITPKDVDSSYYQILEQRLQQIRHTSNAIKDIYTLRQQPNGQIVFVIDCPSFKTPKATIGKPLPLLTPLLKNGLAAITQPMVESSLQKNEMGDIVIYGYAPITDHVGRLEGVLAIELDASAVIVSEFHAQKIALINFLVTLPLALIVGRWLVQHFTAPLAELAEGAERIAQGQLDYFVNGRSQDEIGVLVRAFNHMTEQLRLFYQRLEERAEAERLKAEELAQTLEQLQQTQTQLIQTEKMSSLGQMAAAVAHEINNPVCFIAGNINHAQQYTKDLITLVKVYQRHYPHPMPEIEDFIKEMDLNYLISDLPELLESMKEGTDRIWQISVAMRTFSRSDTDKKVFFNVHEGINSTLMILKHKLKANNQRPAIEVIKHYGELPLIKCYPGQLNQVFMNIISNAIDALEEVTQGKSFAENLCHLNQIIIETEVLADPQKIVIRIKDNGPGIPESVQQQMFDYLFTTKGVGKGTGIGLSISQQIVVDKHQGKLECMSTIGQGTTFIIELPIDVSSNIASNVVER